MKKKSGLQQKGHFSHPGQMGWCLSTTRALSVHVPGCKTTTLLPLPDLNPGLSWIKSGDQLGHVCRNEMCSVQSGMDAVSPHQIRFPPESLPVVYVAHIVRWAPPRQPAVEWRHSAKQFVIDQIREGTRENYGVRQCLGISTHRFHINFSTLIPTDITILLYLRFSLTSRFKRDSMSPALAPGRQTTGPWLRYFHVPDYRASDTQGVLLSGCVAEQGKPVWNVKWLVHSGLLYRLTTPANSYPASRLPGNS